MAVPLVVGRRGGDPMNDILMEGRRGGLSDFGDHYSLDATVRHMREASRPEPIDRRMREDRAARGSTDLYQRSPYKARRTLETRRPAPLPGAKEGRGGWLFRPPARVPDSVRYCTV